MDAVNEATSVEIWEATTEATVFINVRDTFNGGWKKVRCSTRGPKRVQVTVEERRFNQDSIPEENMHLDPFSNGQLVCVQGEARGPNLLTDDDLRLILGLDSDDEFEQTVREIESELILRRLLNLSEKNATHVRFEFLRDIVDERFRVGGTQRTVQAMIDAGEKIVGTAIRA